MRTASNLPAKEAIRQRIQTPWGKKAFDFYYNQPTPDYYTPYTPDLDEERSERERVGLLLEFYLAAPDKITDEKRILALVEDANLFSIAVTCLTTVHGQIGSIWGKIQADNIDSQLKEKIASAADSHTEILTNCAQLRQAERDVFISLEAHDTGASLKLALDASIKVGIDLKTLTSFEKKLSILAYLFETPLDHRAEKLKLILSYGITIPKENAQHFFAYACQHFPKDIILLKEIAKYCPPTIFNTIETNMFSAVSGRVYLHPIVLVLSNIAFILKSGIKASYADYIKPLEYLASRGSQLTTKVVSDIFTYTTESNSIVILQFLLNYKAMDHSKQVETLLRNKISDLEELRKKEQEEVKATEDSRFKKCMDKLRAHSETAKKIESMIQAILNCDCKITSFGEDFNIEFSDGTTVDKIKQYCDILAKINIRTKIFYNNRVLIDENEFILLTKLEKSSSVLKYSEAKPILSTLFSNKLEIKEDGNEASYDVSISDAEKMKAIIVSKENTAEFEDKINQFKKQFLTWPPLTLLKSERKQIAEFYQKNLLQFPLNATFVLL